MAAAEARATWQRLSNRCFVQEDAKRAPRLACCPSASSKRQYETATGEGLNETDDPASNFLPLNWNPTISNLSPGTKWWLQLQPNFGHRKDFTYEQLNAVDNRLEEKMKETNKSVEHSGESMTGVNCDSSLDKYSNSFPVSPCMVSTTFMKNDCETKVEQLKAANSCVQPPLKHKADFVEYWYEGDELMDWKTVDQFTSEKPDKAFLDLGPQWNGERTEPWWRIADKDELALLVAQKSLDHIENCDLPRPQKVHIRADPFACLESLDDNGILSSSFDQNLHVCVSNQANYVQQSSGSWSMNNEQKSSNEVGKSLSTKQQYSVDHAHSVATKHPQERNHASDTDPGKAQLLEALCHSQTRAREAETAAQQAYNEREHIIKLFFKQASHLFAYKQWLRLLQLESLCLQLKISEQQLSSLFPAMPWMPTKGDQMGNDGKREARRKGRKQKRCDICRYVFAFAVGVGLASAGILLGWTLGWLLPVL